MLNNFIEVGINESDIHILLSYDSEVDTKTYYVWNKIIEKYKGVNFYFYKDSRINKDYVSSIRPNVLMQFYKDYPDFSKKTIFYHDCDILFTKPVDFSELLNDDIWYLSDTTSYINYEYINSKGHGIYEMMCNIIGIDTGIPKMYNNDSGGAQYIIKNVDWRFWETVESDSELLFTKMTEYNISLKTEYPNYHELQIWCADMWALLWGAWKAGHETKVIKEMDFCWATDGIQRWNECLIYHNAGVTSDRTDMFLKSNYQTTLPYNLDLSKLNKSYCNYKYVEEILKNKGGIMSDIKLCFVQVTSPEIHDYSKYSVEINKKYCEKQGYDYLELPTVKRNEYAPQWSKVFQVKDILKTGDYTHVFFLDADAVVINRNKKLEEVIDKMTTPIAFSENGWNGGDKINTGAFICTPEAIEILEKCITLSEEDMKEKKLNYWHEQAVITKMYEDGVKMDVFSMNEINSYWLYDIESNDGQFVYHFMARPFNEKIEIAKKLFEKYK